MQGLYHQQYGVEGFMLRPWQRLAFRIRGWGLGVPSFVTRRILLSEMRVWGQIAPVP